MHKNSLKGSKWLFTNFVRLGRQRKSGVSRQNWQTWISGEIPVTINHLFILWLRFSFWRYCLYRLILTFNSGTVTQWNNAITCTSSIKIITNACMRPDQYIAQRTYPVLQSGDKTAMIFFSFSEPRNLLAVYKDKAVPSYWSDRGSNPLIMGWFYRLNEEHLSYWATPFWPFDPSPFEEELNWFTDVNLVFQGWPGGRGRPGPKGPKGERVS